LSLELLVRAVIGPAVGAGQEREVSAALRSYLASSGPSVLRLLSVLEASLRWYLGWRGAPGNPEVAEAELDRVARRLYEKPYLREAVEGIKALVLLVWGANEYAEEIKEAALRNPPSRPDPELNLVPAGQAQAVLAADVVVVGSGAGGAVAAREFARAGYEVAILEEGQRYGVEYFRNEHPLERWRSLYVGGGINVCLGRPPIVLPVGRGVGGTTLVNSGTCYRPPGRVLRKWVHGFGIEVADPAEIGPYLEEIEKLLCVQPVPLGVMGRNGRTLLEGASRLGWKAGPLLRNAAGCDGCCQCALGCPHNAKMGVHLSVLPDACAQGAVIYTGARAETILMRGRRADGVFFVDESGLRRFVRARAAVVVAAGALSTPLLLRRSGLAAHPLVGRNLAIHPAVACAGFFQEAVYAWRGVLQSAAVEEFHESEGILMEATSTPPGMGSMLLPGIGSELSGWLRESHRLATLGAMVADAGVGRVLGRRRPVVVYQMRQAEAARLLRAIKRMGELLFAAGAREVVLGSPGTRPVSSPEELAAELNALAPSALHVAAFHPTGTCAAGASDQLPTDAWGFLRGTDNVMVLDGSILPSSPEVNPQVSIMALSMALARQAARRLGHG
jgi:choline dehydrogenase-like flavoprotein